MKEVKCSYRAQQVRGSRVYICRLLDEEARAETITYEMTGWTKEQALDAMNKRINDFGYEAVYEA